MTWEQGGMKKRLDFWKEYSQLENGDGITRRVTIKHNNTLLLLFNICKIHHNKLS